MYNINFEVKYKNIEEDLLKKNEYTEDEINNIIDQLFRHELLSVFYAKTIDDCEVDEELYDIWLNISDYKPFMEIFEEIRAKLKIGSMDDSTVFTQLFSFKYFYIIHKCICQYYKMQKIDKNLLEKLIEKIRES